MDVVELPGATKRTVHFGRWLHFARQLCLSNKVEMFLVGTEIKTKFLKCRDYLLRAA